MLTTTTDGKKAGQRAVAAESGRPSMWLEPATRAPRAV